LPWNYKFSADFLDSSAGSAEKTRIFVTILAHCGDPLNPPVGVITCQWRERWVGAVARKRGARTGAAAHMVDVVGFLEVTLW